MSAALQDAIEAIEDGVPMDFIASLLFEKSPPGWSGTTKAMKRHHNIKNPFALSWSMKKKGYHPHYKPHK